MRASLELIYQADREHDSLLFGTNIDGFPKSYYSHSATSAETLPLFVPFAGNYEMIAGSSRNREHSEVFSLEYLTEGKLQFTQNLKEYEIEPGDLFLVRKNADSRMKCISELVIKWAVAVDGALLFPLLDALNLNQCDVIRKVPPERFLPAARSLNALLLENTQEALQQSSGTVYQLLLDLETLHKKEELPEEIAAPIRYMELHYSEALTIPFLALHFGQNRCRLFRNFRHYLGMTPMECLTQIRMRHARQFLQQHLPVKDVARSCGYTDPLYFSKVFRRIHGIAPSSFPIEQ